jgi:hypothetical protein
VEPARRADVAPTTTVPSVPPAPADHDISSRAFWAKDPVERDETFRRLRTEAPVSRHLPIETSLPPEVHGQTGSGR